MATTIRRWVLAERPAGLPRLSDFRLEEVPLRDPGPGEFLVQLEYHSVDPGVRPMLVGDTYTAAVPLGKPVPSFGVGRVVQSAHPGIPVGTRVAGTLGWYSHAIANDRMVEVLDPALYGDDIPASAAIGVLGVSGLTAYFGLLGVGALQPGERVLVSSVGGPVGATAAQIARIKGNPVVGIAGSPDKCAYARDRLRLDDCLDYRAEPDLAAAIARVLPDGVDVYLDNVGGETLDAALLNMRERGRVAISGQLSEYNRDTPRGIRATTRFISKRIRMEGFVVFDFMRDFASARAQMADWIRAGDLVFDERIVDGIEHSAALFVGLFEKDQVGRTLVKLS